MVQETTVMRAQKVNDDITALLRARNTLLWVVTREEVRVERALTEAAAKASYMVRFWDCANGISDLDGKQISANGDPAACIQYIKDNKDRCVYILRDLHKWLDAMTLRGVRSLARQLQTLGRNEARSIVVLTPSAEVPAELAGHATVIDYPIPDRAEVATILDSIVESLPKEMREKAVDDGMRDACIDAAVGLTAEEVANCYSRSVVTKRRIDPAMVSSEKRRVIAREKVLTWHEPDPRGMDGIGGLDVLKAWLVRRKAGFSAQARAYGLPAPKGVMLVGVPGAGKSLTAKCIASAWQVPLLRLDLGALRSKYVGDSEANIRKALQVAEAVSPCVLWLDEVEKAMAGATGSQGDGGVAADALGTILSWMQERSGSVFVVATANDVRALPPEFLRKGRFDDVFFVDLPSQAERTEIIGTALAQYNQAHLPIDRAAVAEATDGFTGAEIAALVPDAMFDAFADSERALTTADVLKAASTVVPLAKTASEKIEALRNWAKGKARLASTPAASATAGKTRAVDVDIE